MRATNRSRADELMRTVEDLESVVSKGRPTDSQLAKLFGFTEKLLLTRIDNMQVTLDGGDAVDVELKKTRKDLVGRCNALMDGLEKLKEDIRTPTDTIAAGISIGEDDLLQLAAVLNDCTPLRTVAVTSSGDGSAAADAVGYYQPSIQSLMAGFFPSLATACVVARHDLNPYTGMCAREEEGRSGRRMRTVHTHTAAAAAIASLSPGNAACCLFLSFSASAFYFSIIRIDIPGQDSPSQISFVLSQRHHISTRGAQHYVVASAATIVPMLAKAVTEAKAEGLSHIDGVILASSGPKTNTMYTYMRTALCEAFPDVPIVYPALDESNMLANETKSFRGVRIEPEFVAHGAAVLAMSSLHSANVENISPRLVHVYDEPLACVVGLRARLMPAESYQQQSSETVSDLDSELDSLMTVIPFFTPLSSSSPGESVEKTLTLMTYGASHVGTSPATKRGEVAAARNNNDLFLELVQVNVGCSGMATPGWADGVLQTAVPKKVQATTMSKLSGLSIVPSPEANGPFLTGGALSSTRGPFRYRVLARYRVEKLFDQCSSEGSEGPIALQQLLVKMELDDDRNVRMAVRSGVLDSLVEAVVADEAVVNCNFENSLYHLSTTATFSPEPTQCFYVASPEEAERLKKKGNAHLKAGIGGAEFDSAVSAVLDYSLALQWDPLNAVLYSNRCAARLKMCTLQRMQSDPTRNVDMWLSECLIDAQVCVQLRPTWSKGHSRLGEVLFRQNRLEASLEAYNKAYSCEVIEQNVPPGTSPASNSSSILKSIREVQGALDLQAATKAAQEAERILKGENSGATADGVKSGTKKRKKDESSSRCIIT